MVVELRIIQRQGQADVGTSEQKLIIWIVGVGHLSKEETCNGFMGTII